MPVHDDLGKRMKGYEQVAKTSLMKRVPVAIRIDGKAFHTFTKGMNRPFDNVLIESMQKTMEYLCKNIQGCVFGYTQSDEITLILTDYKTFMTSAWYDNEVQKICSISASMATMAFNKFFTEIAEDYIQFCATEYETKGKCGPGTKEYELCGVYQKAMQKGAMFDSRCFNISKEEACNLVYWRQLDATRNSIQMVGQAHFSQKELNGKSCNMIQEMLFVQKGINWNDYSIFYKRGTACIPCHAIGIEHTIWYIDKNMPILKGEDRNYLERYL